MDALAAMFTTLLIQSTSNVVVDSMRTKEWLRLWCYVPNTAFEERVKQKLMARVVVNCWFHYNGIMAIELDNVVSNTVKYQMCDPKFKLSEPLQIAINYVNSQSPIGKDGL